jgi:response regulator of citrate/malate metabolism
MVLVASRFRRRKVVNTRTAKIRETIEEALQDSDYGLTTRSLAEETGYSHPTVSKYCGKMVDDDILEVVEKGSSKIYLLDQSEVEG